MSDAPTHDRIDWRTRECNPAQGTLSPIEAGRLKTSLLARGLSLSDSVRGELSRGVRPPLRVRSGSCGGLDVVLPGGTYVNCPIYEDFAHSAPYQLDRRPDGRLILEDSERVEEHEVALLPFPDYYHRNASGGQPLTRIGQLCGDRLGIGLTNDCVYWRDPSRRCKFCSIGLNLGVENRRKTVDEILEVVEAAYADPVAPARHILLGGGTPDGPDAGALAIAEAARAIKARWSQPIYAMIAAPADGAALECLVEAGVDELGMNIEVFDPDAAARLIPGKHKQLGLDHYLRLLERAVTLFGRLATRSIMVVGLEPLEATVAGVERLASIGVMPILSPFRPLKGTDLGHLPPPSFERLWETLLAAVEAAATWDVPLGPLCIPCQGNTLTIRNHEEYRFY